MRTFIIVIVVCVAACTAANANVRLLRVESLGRFECAGSGVRYEVDDSQVFAAAYANPSKHNLTVESVVFGHRNLPGCRALKHEGFHSAFIPPGECETKWSTENGLAVFENRVFITVHNYVAPGVIIDDVFQQRIVCRVNLTMPVMEPTDNAVISCMPGPDADFQIKVDVTASSEVITDFGGLTLPTQVITLSFAIADPVIAQLFALFVDHCYATSNSVTDQPRYNIIDTQGCVPPTPFSMVQVIQGPPLTLRFRAFKFSGTAADDTLMQITCQINMCKQSGDLRNCRQRCAGGAQSTNAAVVPHQKVVTWQTMRGNGPISPGVIILDGVAHEVASTYNPH